MIHVGKGMDVQMVVATNWDGWAQDVRIVENDFKVAGTARYGSESGRSGPDYLIKAGSPRPNLSASATIVTGAAMSTCR
ncbi:hypothetical protein ACFSUK_26210 [Sphingobium scionense]